MELSKEIDELTYKIIGICMEVHRELGPGLPEEYYQKSLEVEFAEQGVLFEAQKPLPLHYKQVQVGMNYLDFEIVEALILEIKSVNQLTNVHMFQVLKYLAVSNLQVALLVNFGKARLEYRRLLPTKKWQEFKMNSLFEAIELEQATRGNL
ncbi:MAG: GxxExxY protein [Ignavibacteriae bacterium]|nr:GxxExxY protein [Ignavibacteria bacterium]MBI3363592.1 GxxExxY protein [Ignavibacteriota bacterium]